MANIYQAALDAKFLSIMNVLARQRGYDEDLSGLTVENQKNIRDLAEQAIVDWTAARETRPKEPIPLTNLQHLLHEYCAIADHL